MKRCKKATRLSNKMKNHFSFMAWGTGRDIKEAPEFKKFIGVGVVGINSVNPPRDGVEYVGEIDGIPTVRLAFSLAIHPTEHSDISGTTFLNLMLRKEYRYTNDKNKIQVVDKYGRFAWVTKDEMAGHKIPVNNGTPARLDADYRPAFSGEEPLTKMMKTFMGIKEIDTYQNGAWVPNPDIADPAECEARFDTIDKLFKGNFKELQDLIEARKNNKFKIVFGIRTTDDGREFQAFYTDRFLSLNARNISRVDAEIKARQDAGGYKNTVFDTCPLKEYVVEATDFNNTVPMAEKPAAAESDMPFDMPTW